MSVLYYSGNNNVWETGWLPALPETSEHTESLKFVIARMVLQTDPSLPLSEHDSEAERIARSLLKTPELKRAIHAAEQSNTLFLPKYMVPRAIRNIAMHWFDIRTQTTLAKTQLAKCVEFHGDEHLERALNGGKGAVLALPHAGSEVLRTALADKGLRPMIPFHATDMKWWVDALIYRGRLNSGTYPLQYRPGIMSDIEGWLQRGNVVMLYADTQSVGGNKGPGVEVCSFGRNRWAPAGPAALALKGFPVLTAASSSRCNGKIDVVIDDVVPDVEMNVPHSDAIQQIMQHVFDRFEAHINSDLSAYWFPIADIKIPSELVASRSIEPGPAFSFA